MPIYEYSCPQCGNEFEELVASHSTQVTCKKCASDKVQRKLSSFSPKVASPSSGCAMRQSCPAANSHACGGSCGCGGH